MIKRIYDIIPKSYSASLGLNIILAIISQILDFISVILLLPVLLAIFNPAIFATHGVRFIPFTGYILDYPVKSLAIVVVFYILKNLISIKILRFQSDYYFAISNALSVSLMQNFLNKELLEVKSERNSIVMKDIIFVPNNFVSFVFGAFNQLIADCFLMLLILLGCFYINPLATVCLFFITVTLIVAIYLYDKKKLDIMNKAVDGKYNSNFNHLMNTLNGFVEIKVNRLEEYFIQKFSSSNAGLNKIYSQLTSDRLAKPKYTETFIVIIIAFLFLSSKYLVNDIQTNTVFIAFLFAASIKIIPAVNRMLISITNLKSNLYTIEILQKNAIHKNSHRSHNETIPFEHNIELRDLSFGFKDSKLLLDKINLTIRKGEIIGIFGDSGIGKSTLINIITSLIKPTTGELYCDNKSVVSAGKSAYIDNIAYVPQAPFVMEGTIKENLHLDGNPVENSVLDYYLNLFELNDVILQLPKGINTFIGSNGYTLSGGQLQRLAIIRAFLRKPGILFLDEATNQMDEQLRQRISDAIKGICKKSNITVIAVSHNQMELKLFADSVYELKNASLFLTT